MGCVKRDGKYVCKSANQSISDCQFYEAGCWIPKSECWNPNAIAQADDQEKIESLNKRLSLMIRRLDSLEFHARNFSSMTYGASVKDIRQMFWLLADMARQTKEGAPEPKET